MKVKKIKNGSTTFQYLFNCPGCKCEHAFDDRWKFNEDLEKPTISPSFLQQGSLGFDGEKQNYGTCHSFIKEGKIQFLTDCTHDLKGQTVDLIDYKD